MASLGRGKIPIASGESRSVCPVEEVPDDVAMLNLSQFASLDDAIEKCAAASRRYEEAVTTAGGLAEGAQLTHRTMFLMSAVARSRGLHEGVVSELRNSNPHAVFPLMRSLAETALMLDYVIAYPDYVVTFSDIDPGYSEKRVSIGKLLKHSEKRFAQMRGVYAQLCDVTHFGSIAFWWAFSIKPDADKRTLQWRSSPVWRDEGQALIACGQLMELSEIIPVLLGELIGRHVTDHTAEK